MTISEENILKRWADFSDAEKWGSDPAYTASVILSIMADLIDTGRCLNLTNAQEGLLLGFQINTGFDAEDGFSFVHCLDLHSVAVDKHNFNIISELDSYFMEQVKVNGISFWNRYLDRLHNPY